MDKITLESIAQKLNLSVSTVSRTLNGKAKENRISKKTSDRIFREARRCNYKPEIISRNIVLGKSGQIGLLFPTLSNPYFAELASEVIRDIQRTGYTPVILDTMEDSEIFKNNIKNLVSRGIEGIIAAPCGMGEDEKFFLENIDKSYCPIVMIDRFFENSNLSYVTTNNGMGGMMAVDKLFEAGHKKITMIQGDLNSMPNYERARGYRKAMELYDLSNEINVVGDKFSVENGYFEMKKLIKNKRDLTAIFTASNTILKGAVKAIYEEGLQIGKDISIISFDKYIQTIDVGTTISIFRQSQENMAELSVKILLGKINGTFKGSSQIMLNPVYVPGNSIRMLR